VTRGGLVITAALLFVHYGLVAGMADVSVVDQLLAAGPHTPWATLAAALVFVLVRVAALVLLPGALVAWAVWAHCGKLRPARISRSAMSGK
jgi:hypothetical protein